MLKCPFCQFPNEDGALFCERCKSDLLNLPPTQIRAVGPEKTASAEAGQPGSGPTISSVSTFVPTPAGSTLVAEAASAAPTPVVQIEASPPPGEGSVPVALPVTDSARLPDSLEIPIAAPLATPPINSGVAPQTMHPGGPSTSQRQQPPSTNQSASSFPPPQPLPPGAQPKLVVLRGLKLNVEYPLYEGHNFIGRADEKPVDIDLEDQEPVDRIWCSRQHALISFEDQTLYIEDLNSSNGTFVNRARIYPGQRRPLHVGDVIQVGTVQLKVKL